MNRKSAKSWLKKAAADMMGNKAAFSFTNRLLNRPKFPFVRAIGYHDTPGRSASKLRAQFQWFSENFVDCNRERLDRFLSDGSWPYDKPGIIISFDDGLRSNATVAAPLLKQFGFTGWFMVPAIVPDIGVTADREFADAQLIPFTEENPANRLFMSWDDLRSLVAQGHEICCHSLNHKRLGAFLTPSELVEEIEQSKAILERELSCPVDNFAWVGGEDYSFSAAAFAEMQRAGFRRIFSTNCYPLLPRQSPFYLERNHVDADFGINEVRLSIGGLYDLFYRRKRQRINYVIGLKEK